MVCVKGGRGGTKDRYPFLSPGFKADAMSQNIQHGVYHTSYSFTSQITQSDTRPHAKWAVSLVIADGFFKFFLGSLCWS